MILQIKWLVFISSLFISNQIISASSFDSDFCHEKLYLIRNPTSGLVLDASNGTVTMQHFDGFAPQLWKFKLASLPGLFYIINKNTRTVLDVDKSDSKRIIVKDEDGSLTQQWYLHSNGRIINADSKKLMDVQGGTLIAGNRVIVWTDNGNNWQEFIIKERLTCCPSMCSSTNTSSSNSTLNLHC